MKPTRGRGITLLDLELVMELDVLRLLHDELGDVGICRGLISQSKQQEKKKTEEGLTNLQRLVL